MSDPDLADRILAALTESEHLERQPVVRSDQLLAQLAATEDEKGTAPVPRDTQGQVHGTPGLIAGDVVVLQPSSRAANDE